MKPLLPLLPFLVLALVLGASLLTAAVAEEAPRLPGTEPLGMEGDLAAQMVAGIDRFLTLETAGAVEQRGRRWKRDRSSPKAYSDAGAPYRERLRAILGLRPEERRPGRAPEVLASPGGREVVAVGKGVKVYAVRWAVIEGVDAEGLLLEPGERAAATVVAVPDCDQTPETIAGLAPGLPPGHLFARRLAESGCRVLVPALVDRSDRFSGRADVRWTNQPHREFIYRAGFEMGRSLVGMEVQKLLAAVDLFHPAAAGSAAEQPVPIGVAGYGEGALLALYAAALDPRIDAALVSGYFQPREALWKEPIYRNLFGLLPEFGDAEIASLVRPGGLVVEYSRGPEVPGPPPAREGRSGAAPGVLNAPAFEVVEKEVRRARELLGGLKLEGPALQLVRSPDGLPGSDEALSAFLRALGVLRPLARPGRKEVPLQDRREAPPDPARQQRQFEQLLEYTQRLMREGEYERAKLWGGADVSSPDAWKSAAVTLRNKLWDEVIGRLPPASLPPSARSRLIYDEPKYRGYEVVLDVWPDVFAYGILLVPKELKPGERRAVMVCQHGLEGRPQDVADIHVDSPYYHAFAARLAEKGYVTFSPQNPYIGGDAFRVLQRKANPLGQSLFSIIVRQHERILEWLGTQPFVDSKRIGFYGLSYGGKTAMRVPALLEGYCLSICSADYNEWIWKNVSARSRYSYLFTGEYEMPEWNLGNVANYAEMSWLICPRPFMVERGHDDGVAPDEWVAYEYARTRRHYDKLGLGDRTELEVFNGPHTIHGVGTFAFLDRHLQGK
jgi:dienelactone hydrolase